MFRIRSMTALLALTIGVFGCSKSANQSASSETASPSGSPSESSSAASAKKEAAAKAKPLVIPADTEISVVLDEPISSKTSSAGQKFTATVAAPVEIGGRVAIPKGARSSGVVREAKAAGRFKGGAVLDLKLTSVTVRDADYEIQTSAPVMTSKGKGKRTAAMVGGGAGGGAAIGAVAGGGKGAAIGALIGAAAGTGGAGLTGNRDITLPAETALTFKLTQPLEIKQK